jgi:hypothetical protein
MEESGTAGPSCFWLSELLSRDFDNIRVLTHGCDSNISHFCKGPPNQMTISQHGGLLDINMDSNFILGHVTTLTWTEILEVVYYSQGRLGEAVEL